MDKKSGERLKDWHCNSYNDEGRYNTLESKQEKSGNEMSKHGDGMKEKGGPDGGRRNK